MANCNHPRPKLNLPGYTPPRLPWQPPTLLPTANVQDLARALTEQFRGVYAVLQQLGQTRTVVPLIEDIDARPGQVIVGVGNGQTIRLPEVREGQAERVSVVLTDVSDTVTIVNPDATVERLAAVGSYDYVSGTQMSYQRAPSGGVTPREFALTISGDTTWTDFDLAAACSGIQAGDVVSLVLAGNLTVHSIIPPREAFTCRIGIAELDGGDYTVRFVDRLNGSGGTTAYKFRTPRTPYPDTYAADFVLSSEEAWTSIGYTDSSDNWRIFENHTMDPVWLVVALSESATPAENTQVLQDAIDSGQTHLQMPAGTFELSAGGVSLASGVHLRGMGIDITVLTWEDNDYTTDPGSQGVLNIHGASSGSPITGVVIEDFTVDGNKAGVTTSASGEPLDIECISYEFAHDCVARRVRCINAEGDGFDYDDCVRCVTEDCFAEDCDGFGCHNSLRTTHNRHMRFTAIDCGAVHSRGGLDAHGTSPNESTDNSFTDCVVTGCYRGILLGGHRNNVKGCRVSASTNTGIRVAGNDNSVTASVVTATSGNNFTIDGGDRNTITGCNGSDATSSGAGILLVSGSINNVIAASQFHGNSGRGIQLNAGANTNIVVGNVSRNNSTANLLDSGTSNTLASNITT